MGSEGLEGRFMDARPLLRRLLAARLGSSDEVEDALQDLWLRVAGLDAEQIDQPIPFLCRMATNLATDRRIAAARRGARDGAWEKIQPQPAEYADPERIASGRSELAQAHALIARMPERMREAFTLFRFEERPQRDIAEHMGITVSAVEKLLRRAYQFLHENREVEGADRTRWRRPGSGRSGDE
ncbi:sigma-70 family RNA polymerase sigma factor [Sphingomonas zeae]